MTDKPRIEVVNVTDVTFLPFKVWIENDLFGGRHVMIQHEGQTAFCYATFGYHHLYTSNSMTLNAAMATAKALVGDDREIEIISRPIPEVKPLSPGVVRNIVLDMKVQLRTPHGQSVFATVVDAVKGDDDTTHLVVKPLVRNPTNKSSENS